jgi:hypothetical protein
LPQRLSLLRRRLLTATAATGTAATDDNTALAG